MKIVATDIPDVKIIHPSSFKDDRGVFSETYRRDILKNAGIDINFIQDNRSLSKAKFTVRGLHYQISPFAQAKLVSVQAGRIFDVAVDLRRGSPFFGRHVSTELTAEGGEQILIPVGFAHGFCTLEPDTVVTYKVDSLYSPAHDRGLHWLSFDLAIEWPCGKGGAVLSPKDMQLPDRIDPAACFS